MNVRWPPCPGPGAVTSGGTAIGVPVSHWQETRLRLGLGQPHWLSLRLGAMMTGQRARVLLKRSDCRPQWQNPWVRNVYYLCSWFEPYIDIARCKHSMLTFYANVRWPLGPGPGAVTPYRSVHPRHAILWHHWSCYITCYITPGPWLYSIMPNVIWKICILHFVLHSMLSTWWYVT